MASFLIDLFETLNSNAVRSWLFGSDIVWGKHWVVDLKFKQNMWCLVRYLNCEVEFFVTQYFDRFLVGRLNNKTVGC